MTPRVVIVGPPGAGKTSFILQTIKHLEQELKIGVIEGDTAPVTIDADKITKAGMPAVQINIRAGELPPKEANGIAYAKIPLNAL